MPVVSIDLAEKGQVVHPYLEECLSRYSRHYYQEYNRIYHFLIKITKRMSYIYKHLNIAVAFTTSLFYLHKFINVRGFCQVHWALLAVSSFFLALKTENFSKIGLKELLPLAFEDLHTVKSAKVSTEKEKMSNFQVRKSQIILTERMLCHTLNFNFEVIHPHVYMGSLLKHFNLNAKDSAHKHAYSLLMCIIQTPLSINIEPHTLAEGVIMLISDGLSLLSNRENSIAADKVPFSSRNELISSLKSTPEELDKVKYAVLVYFYRTNKRSHIDYIDQQVIDIKRLIKS